MAVNLRPSDAPWDPALNIPTVNQENAAGSVFDFVQALRRASESDGNLSAQEVFAIAIAEAPSGAMAFVALVRDPVALDEDLEAVGHLVYRQLTGGV